MRSLNYICGLKLYALMFDVKRNKKEKSEQQLFTALENYVLHLLKFLQHSECHNNLL